MLCPYRSDILVTHLSRKLGFENSHEIRKTDSSFFKQSLRDEETVVENLLAKLSAVAVTP